MLIPKTPPQRRTPRRPLRRRPPAVPVPPPPQDPYSALINQAPRPYTPGQVQRQINQYTSRLPAPLTYDQIQQRASGLISPLVQQITDAINAQARQRADAIRGYTQSLAGEVGKIQWQQPYFQGEQAQAATDAALHQALTGAGAQDAADLQHRLAVINDPAVAQAAQQVTANAAGNANANLALGTSAMDNLIAQAAAAGSFGQKLPAIAKLGGIQQLGQLASDTTAQIGQQTGLLEQQIPGLVQNLQSASDTNQTNRAQAGQDLFRYLTGVNDSRSHDLLGLRETQQQRRDTLRLAGEKNQATVTAAQIKAASAAQVAAVRARGQASAAELKAAQSDRTYRLQYARTFGFDPVTGRTIAGYRRTADGGVAKIGKPGTGTGKNGQKLPTANQISTWVEQWKNGKPVTITNPVNVDAKGNPVPDAEGKVQTYRRTVTTGTRGYQEAYKFLRSQGVPDRQAREALDSAYRRGEQGRAWLTNEEQTILRRAGLKPSVRLVNGHPVLGPAQVAALRKAGRLPAGQLTQEGALVVSQTS